MKSAMLFFLTIILVVGLIQTTTANSSKINDGNKAPTLSNQLVGTWKFISVVGKSSEGEVYHPYGENLFGMLMYDSKGYMSVLLMNPDRPKFASGDMWKGTPEELKAAFEGFDAYCGTYVIDAEASKVTHNLLGSKFPNWVGTAQVRFFKISGDKLHIKAPPIFAGGVEWNIEAVLIRL